MPKLLMLGERVVFGEWDDAAEGNYFIKAQVEESRRAMRIGVLGGTFDPIHVAHLIIAEEARTRLELNRVLFVPAGGPYHKPERPISEAQHRIEMTRLAIESNAHFELSLVDVERQGPSYTVDTLAALREVWGAEAEFYFIIGLDALAELPTWKEPERLVSLCHLVVVPRPGWNRGETARLAQRVSGLSDRLVVLEAPQVDISSSEIRRRRAEGLPIRYLVPEAVRRYIWEQGLYLRHPK